eukprot:6207169-Pleurochrysis_carterae.AAC.1
MHASVGSCVWTPVCTCAHSSSQIYPHPSCARGRMHATIRASTCVRMRVHVSMCACLIESECVCLAVRARARAVTAGVYLSDEYLFSVPAAEEITARILQQYAAAAVEARSAVPVLVAGTCFPTVAPPYSRSSR